MDLLLNFDRKKKERRKKKDNSPLLELLGFAATKNRKKRFANKGKAVSVPGFPRPANLAGQVPKWSRAARKAGRMAGRQ